MTKELDTLEQMAVSLKVINGEVGDMLKSIKAVKYFLIFNSLVLSVGLVKYLLFTAP